MSANRLQHLTDEDLVELALQAGTARRRERAFSELHARYVPQIRSRLRRKIPVEERADDLVNVVFTRVYSHLHRFDPDRADFSTWVWTIATNLWRNEVRDDGRRFIYPESDLIDDDGPGDRPLRAGALYEDAGADPERDALRRRVRDVVEEEIAELAPHTRIVIVLRELQDRSYQEIAKLIGLKLGTIKSRLNRGRARLAGRLRERGLAGPDLEEADLNF